MSYWIADAVQCGFSRQWELRRMSDQVLPGLIQFLESVSSTALVQMIRGPHRTWLDRARACLCARHGLRQGTYTPPDLGAFVRWVPPSDRPDRLAILALSVLWDLVAKSAAARDRHLPTVLARTGQLLGPVPGPVRDWFAHSIGDAIGAVAARCPGPQLGAFVAALLGLARTVSAPYRPQLVRTLARVDLEQVSDAMGARIADLCLAMVADRGADAVLALDLLDRLAVAHANPDWISDLFTALSRRRHGRDHAPDDASARDRDYDGLLVTPSTGHVKKLSLDSDSGQSTTSNGSSTAPAAAAAVANNNDNGRDQSEWDDGADSDPELDPDPAQASDLDLERRVSVLVQRLAGRTSPAEAAAALRSRPL